MSIQASRYAENRVMPAPSSQTIGIRPFIVFTILAILVTYHECFGQCSSQELARASSPDPGIQDYFGTAIAIEGDTAVVGAYADDHPTILNAGSAYVYSRMGDTWSWQATLIASDASEGDIFGASVAISGDTIVVGANEIFDSPNSGPGAAYVFVKLNGNWSQQAKLTASDGMPLDQFGGSVAIKGDTIIVGAYNDDNIRGTDAGAAYLFQRTNGLWTEQAKLICSDALPFDRTAISVAMSGDSVILGARDANTPAGVDAGSAYVFVLANGVWTQQAKLTASDAGPSDSFGWSVTIDGDKAVVGAYSEEPGPAQDNTGSAYCFIRQGDTWMQQTKLVASDVLPGDLFGHSVSLSGSDLLIGSLKCDFSGLNNPGAVYWYTYSGTDWNEVAKITASDAASDEWFGYAAAISENHAVAGSFFGDYDGVIDSGKAYFFELTCAPDSDGDGVPDGVDECPTNATGLPVDCDGRPLRDANHDCLFNIEDMPIIVDELIGLAELPLDCEGQPRRDVNGDGLVDGADIQGMVVELLGN